MKRPRYHPKYLLLLLSSVISWAAHGSIECESTEDCTRILNITGTECVNGLCTNPFAQGCLRRYLGEDQFPQKRLCNMHDGDDTTNCELPPMDFNEMRFASSNWDGGIFTAWIFQIFLNEMVQVPASVESGLQINNNFYDLFNAPMSYDAPTYEWEGFENALENHNCREVVSKGKPCVHVIPEIWNGQFKYLRILENEKLIEPTEAGGSLAKYSWYVPRFVAEADHRFVSHFGLAGEENRRILAETFHRPTTWKDYCQLYGCSHDNRTVSGSSFAERPPQTVEEDSMYFRDGLFSGHFRPTVENDCNATELCTGHIANVICGWSTYVVPQAYYLNIHVESSGPGMNGGYDYARMVEIWRAANATRSPVLFYWFQPDSLIQEFAGTDSEFQQILLPFPTQECIDARVVEEERCSSNITIQRGPPEGACDSDTHATQKGIIANLHETSGSGATDFFQSPAYDAIKAFKITDLQQRQMLQHQIEQNGRDRYGYDAREAVCFWAAENVDLLWRFVPRSYPRNIQVESDAYQQPLLKGAIGVGVLSAIFVLFAAALVFHYRRENVMVFAQVDFILLLLAGLLFVSIGAVLSALEPQNGLCVTMSWFVVMGYTLEMVTLIVKVYAINKLMKASRRMKRVQLNRWHLFRAVLCILIPVTIFMIIWTAVDPMIRQEDVYLSETDDVDDSSENPDAFRYRSTIDANIVCKSSMSEAWYYASVGIHAVLLVTATVLAVATREVRSEFNESQQLAVVVYSHFVFLVLRIVTLALQSNVSPERLSGSRSILYSLDVILTVLIYLAPKIFVIWFPPSESGENGVGTRRDSLGRTRVSIDITGLSGMDESFVQGTRMSFAHLSNLNLESIQENDANLAAKTARHDLDDTGSCSHEDRTRVSESIPENSVEEEDRKDNYPLKLSKASDDPKEET
jgi:hypothetical protein